MEKPSNFFLILRFAILWIGLTACGFFFQVFIRMGAKHGWLPEAVMPTVI